MSFFLATLTCFSHCLLTMKIYGFLCTYSTWGSQGILNLWALESVLYQIGKSLNHYLCFFFLNKSFRIV